jgi:two-component system cell cycle response regulator DivK
MITHGAHRAHRAQRDRRLPSRLPLVLIVDDHPDTREMYAMALSCMGLEVTGVATADEAYRCACEARPDVIVTDLSLPRTDGWTLMRWLRCSASTRNIPVVVLTGHAAPELQQRAKHEGCAAFLTKPCLPDQLATELLQLLDRAVVPSQAPETSAPDTAPPQLLCPTCGRPLVHRKTVVGGVKPIEQWHYFECRTCGSFVYRARTRKLRPSASRP